MERRTFPRLTPTPFYREMHREVLPVPWYGRLRNSLSAVLLDLSEWLTALTIRVAYLPEPKYPEPPIAYGTTINFRSFGPLRPHT